MGIFANTGVSVILEDTFPKGRGFLGTLTDSILSWSHTSASIGGYLTANVSLGVTQDIIDEWLEQGLGRWITLFDEGANICWRGFVDQITANVSGLQYVRGPLTQIVNRIYTVFTGANNFMDPPVFGSRRFSTPQIDDTDSQALYGIWAKIYTTGSDDEGGSRQQITKFLRENAQPKNVKSVTLGGKNLSLTLSLKGVWYWLSYPADFTATGTVDLSTRIIQILALDPNGIFSTDYSYITPNTYDVRSYQDDSPPGFSIIRGMFSYGDALYNNYTGGFYGNEVFYYTLSPTQIEYIYSLSEPEQQIRYQSGVVVRPWAVLPARWMQISDLMIGRVSDTDLQDDPRNLFLEQVTYTAPYGLSLNGTKLNLVQSLLQKGLGGT